MTFTGCNQLEFFAMSPLFHRPLLIAGIALWLASPAALAATDPITAFDTDNDHSIDLAEAQKAAAALFDKLDVDHDGTLDAGELKGRLTLGQIKVADPDHDGTLSKDEYLAIVAQRYKRADTDNDQAIDAKELKGRDARALLRLLR